MSYKHGQRRPLRAAELPVSAFSTEADQRGVCCSHTHLNRSVSFPAFV